MGRERPVLTTPHMTYQSRLCQYLPQHNETTELTGEINSLEFAHIQKREGPPQ